MAELSEMFLLYVLVQTAIVLIKVMADLFIFFVKLIFYPFKG